MIGDKFSKLLLRFLSMIRNAILSTIYEKHLDLSPFKECFSNTCMVDDFACFMPSKPIEMITIRRRYVCIKILAEYSHMIFTVISVLNLTVHSINPPIPSILTAERGVCMSLQVWLTNRYLDLKLVLFPCLPMPICQKVIYAIVSVIYWINCSGTRNFFNSFAKSFVWPSRHLPLHMLGF